VATPHDFRIEKIVPSFRPVGRRVRLTEHEVVPICSKLLPISEASLRTPIFDFPFSTNSLVGGRFGWCRDCFELGDFSDIIESGDWFGLTERGSQHASVTFWTKDNQTVSNVRSTPKAAIQTGSAWCPLF
jgi:hypothetical protein